MWFPDESLCAKYKREKSGDRKKDFSGIRI
jgi:hypothetical protein